MALSRFDRRSGQERQRLPVGIDLHFEWVTGQGIGSRGISDLELATERARGGVRVGDRRAFGGGAITKGPPVAQPGGAGIGGDCFELARKPSHQVFRNKNRGEHGRGIGDRECKSEDVALESNVGPDSRGACREVGHRAEIAQVQQLPPITLVNPEVVVALAPIARSRVLLHVADD